MSERLQEPPADAAIGRRAVCVVMLGVAAHFRARAATVRRVAWVSIDSPNPSSQSLRVWREAMRELGWVEGQNLVVDTWWSEGSADKLKALVPQILARRPEVIIANTGPAVRPFVDAKVAVPIVFAFSADPVQAKVVQSWARPGVNRTGVSYFSLELVPKRIQLAKEMLPRLKRVAVVGWPPHAGELLELDAARQAAQAQGLTLEYWGAHTGAEVDAVLGHDRSLEARRGAGLRRRSGVEPCRPLRGLVAAAACAHDFGLGFVCRGRQPDDLWPGDR